MPCDDELCQLMDIPTQEITQSQDIKHQQPVVKKTFDSERVNQQAYRYLCYVQEAKQWIESVLGTSLDCSVGEFEARLQNGVILAKLAQHFCPKVVKRIHDPDGLRPLEFRHSDNVNYFFKALLTLGLPTYFNFELVDIYDRKNMPRVIYCLHVLSRFLNRASLAPAIQPTLTVEFNEEDVLRTQSTLDPLLNMPAFENIENELNAVNKDQEVEECKMDVVEEMVESQSVEDIESNVEDTESNIEETFEDAVTSVSDDTEQLGPIIAQVNEHTTIMTLNALTLQSRVKSWIAEKTFMERARLVELLQRSTRANQAKVMAKQWHSQAASIRALVMDLALIPNELNQKLTLLNQGALDVFEYAECGAEKCRMAILNGYPLITVLPVHTRPNINELCRVLVKQPSKLDLLPAFFNYGRGERAEAAWTEAIISLMPVSKELAKGALESLLFHNMTQIALTEILHAPSLSIRDSIEAFMNLICASDPLMRVISHHPQDASYYLELTIMEAPEIRADILRSIFSFYEKDSLTTTKADDEAEIEKIWRVRLAETIKKHVGGKEQIESWPVCYVHPSLATAMDIYCPPTQTLVFVEEKRMDTIIPTMEDVITNLKQYGTLMANAITTRPKRTIWHKLADSIGLQPTFVKEWITQANPIPGNGVYARTIGHLLKKKALQASTFSNDTMMIFWSNIPGEYYVEVGNEKCCIRLDQSLYSNVNNVELFSNQVTFESRKLVRLISTKLVLL